MKKSILLSALLTSLLVGDEVVKYDWEQAKKTKEVYLYSQLLGEGQKIKIDATWRSTKKRSLFDSFKENTDPDWMGEISVSGQINDCVNIEKIQKIQEMGYRFKSLSADLMVVLSRDAVKQLKKEGAKFVAYDISPKRMRGDEYDVEENKKNSKIINNKTYQTLHAENSRLCNSSTMKNLQFKDFFEDLITNDIFTKNPKSSFDVVPQACYTQQDVSALGLLGQALMLGVGIAGASAGNTDMTAFAGHGSNAISAKNSSLDSKSVSQDPTYGIKHSGIMAERSFTMLGYIDPKYHEKRNEKSIGYIFPIEEVEQYLARFKDIPYESKEL